MKEFEEQAKLVLAKLVARDLSAALGTIITTLPAKSACSADGNYKSLVLPRKEIQMTRKARKS